MKFIGVKYRNRRSVSYLSWKANNDRLLELDGMLKKQAVVLAKATDRVDRVVSFVDDHLVFPTADLSASINRLFGSNNWWDFKLPELKFLTPFFNEAHDELYRKFEPNCQVTFHTTPQLDHVFPKPGDNCTIKSVDDFWSADHVKIALPKFEPTPQQLQREYLLILKDILQREKSAVDKQLSGNRSRVFIALALDLRDRIRVFLRSLHIPTHDGKDEDSVHIGINNPCNIISILKIP